MHAGSSFAGRLGVFPFSFMFPDVYLRIRTFSSRSRVMVSRASWCSTASEVAPAAVSPHSSWNAGPSVLHPPWVSTSVVEPYSSILTTHTTLQHCGCTFTVDNGGISHIHRRHIDLQGYGNLNMMTGPPSSSPCVWMAPLMWT